MDVLREAQSRPLSTLSAYSYIPPRREGTKETSYYNKDSKATELSTFDQLFHQTDGYDNKLHRDDRAHDKGRGLNVYEEERSRVVPVQSSSQCGHRPLLAFYQMFQDQKFSRVACVKNEFYRIHGITWNVAQGYGAVLPV